MSIKKEKENETINTNIEDLNKKENEDVFDEKDIETVDIISASSNVAIEKINQVNNKSVYFLHDDASLVDVFKKQYWKNISDNKYETEIIKEIFKSYLPEIDCIFYKNSAKYFLLYVDVEILSLLIDKVTNNKSFLEKFFRYRDNKYSFILNTMINNDVFKMFEDEMLQNFSSISLARNTEKKVISIKYYSNKNEKYYLLNCFKFKITKEILDAILEVVDIPFYNKDLFVSETRQINSCKNHFKVSNNAN